MIAPNTTYIVCNTYSSPLEYPVIQYKTSSDMTIMVISMFHDITQKYNSSRYIT